MYLAVVPLPMAARENAVGVRRGMCGKLAMVQSRAAENNDFGGCLATNIPLLAEWPRAAGLAVPVDAAVSLLPNVSNDRGGCSATTIVRRCVFHQKSARIFLANKKSLRPLTI
jgi:hypothetical protein